MLEKIKSFLFHNRTTSQTVAKNTFWLGVSNFGGRILRAVIIIYSARVLGAAQWGIFNYAITIVTFLSTFTQLGINRIFVRETAKATGEDERSRILSTSFFIMLALTAIGVSVVFFVAPRIMTIPEAKALLPIAAFILIFDTVREFGFSFIRAIEKMEWEAGLYLFTNLAIVTFGFAFLSVAPSVRLFTYSYAMGTALGMLATYAALRKNVRRLIHNFSAKLVKPILNSAWPFAISSLLGMLMINTDILIIGALRSAEDVGFYSAGQRIVQILYLIPAILMTSLLPAFSRFAHAENQKMRLLLERVISFLFLISIPMSIGGIILGPSIISLLYGHAYLPGAAPFQVLLLTLMADFPANILDAAIFAYNKQKNLIIYSAIGGILNVLLDLVLIPRYGMVGSAWATFVAQIVSNIYLWRVMKKTNEFHVLRYLKKVVIASAGMAAVTASLAAFHFNLFLNIGVSILAYFAILYATREPILRDIKLILAPGTNDL